MNQVEEPVGPNPLGPTDHYLEFQDTDVDDDPDPEMPPFETPTHPIEISSVSFFHGSPYRGPDIWAERWSTYKWEFTPPHHHISRFPPRTHIFRRSRHRHRHRHRQHQNSRHRQNRQGGEEVPGCPCEWVFISAPPTF
ncbi:hypothetical protein Hanom_Chr14g01275101 [Helianthus anomalus]